MKMTDFSFVEIDDAPFRERFIEEVKAHRKANKEWAALTGIPENTVTNLLTIGRKGALRAEYIWAFWDKCPTLDIYYIITGTRVGTDQYLRSTLNDIKQLADQALNKQSPTP